MFAFCAICFQEDVHEDMLVHFNSKMLYDNLTDVVILKIDTEGFKKYRCEINFYGDPQSNKKFKSMFTLESIPTNFISIYK